MSAIWLEVAVILFFSILGYLLSKKLNQPVSLGLIVAGIVIGPSLLNLVTFIDIQSIAQIGGIILLFIVGLESNFRDIYTVKALKVALAGVIAPFIAGYLVFSAMGFAAQSVFIIASALTATSIGITAAVLKELGKINTETAKLILGAAVIDDILALLFLSAASSGFAVGALVLAAIKSVLFVIAAILLSDSILPRLVDAFDMRFGIETPKLTFMLGMLIAFAYSFVAEAIGLSAIVGAFMAGVSLSRSRNVNFFYSGSEFLEAIFTSIFFVSLGVIVDISVALSSAGLIIALTVIALLSKFVACGYIAGKLGFETREAAAVGVGMVPRGEVALIMALYGFTLGLITQAVYASIVLMSFLTTLVTPPVLKHLYSQEKKAKSARK